jgi:hypothetical protein
MSYATLTLSILFFLNLFVFLAGQPASNAPMLALVRVYMSGSVLDLGHYLTVGNLINWGVITGIVIVAVAALSGVGNVTGNTFGGVHALSVIGISLVFALFAIPNFAYMGLPTTISYILTSLLSFMIALSVIGLFKGE